jgi:large subunit ribosomal protein L25
MDSITLDLKQRDVTGKAVKHLRSEGLVPAVIHDHGKPSLIVMGSYVELSKAYQQAGKHQPLSLKAGTKSYMALIKSVDFDPKKHMLRHVVFNAIKANEKVAAEIPVRMTLGDGDEQTPAERAGLVILHQLEVVEVESLPKDLPDVLTFDGEKLAEIGDQVTVADLVVPEGVTVKTDSAHPLTTVFEPSALQAANDAAGGDAEETEGKAAEEVESEHESTAEENTQAAEDQPGGKKELPDSENKKEEKSE